MIDTSTTPLTDPSTDEAEHLVGAWLEGFGAALQGDSAAVGRLFVADSWWRDLLAVSWDFRTVRGSEAIAEAFADAVESRTFLSVSREARATEPLAIHRSHDGVIIEALFDFVTTTGEGRGVLRLREDGEQWRAWTLMTALRDFSGGEQKRGARRPLRLPEVPSPDPHLNWLDGRQRQIEFLDDSPEVLIIGSGHCGLMTAAHLGFWGVPTLIVERNARVGDNWRNRYHSLVLHDAIWADHLPGMPFPDSWPVYTPKDKLGDWLEFYASAMELNVWTSSSMEDATYDDATGRWTVTIRRADGQIRTVHPAHVVVATGVHGEPRIPAFPGMELYQGVTVHSSEYRGDEVPAGGSALVVGAGNSAHDAAQNLHRNGVDVTMIQRSSTYVMSQKANYDLSIGKLFFEGGRPTDDADLLSASYPHPLALIRAVDQTRQMAEIDQEMLAALDKVGYRYDMGIEGGGGPSKILAGPGSYYIDVGCCRLIADGEISLSHSGVERFTPTGVVLEDGTEINVDLVVLATGYSNMRETARRLLGDAEADRCRPVWGLDDGGEISGIWRGSGHPGLWFMGGPLHLARFYSRYLAMQMTARVRGIAAQPTE